MPDSFDPLRVLYGEARPNGTHPTREDLSAAERAELDALAPVKAALETRPPQTPDADVLAAVLEAARLPASPVPASTRAVDRAPVRAGRRRRVPALPVFALVACAVIAGAFVLTQGPDLPLGEDAPALAEAPPASSEADAEAEPTATEPSEVASSGAASSVSESSAPPVAAAPSGDVSAPSRAAAPAPPALTDAPSALADAEEQSDAAGVAVAEAPAARALAPAAAPAARPLARTGMPAAPQPGVALASSAPTWESDSDEDLRLLSLRLQSLREANAGLAWDEPPVPLSAQPLNSRALDLTSDTVHEETRVGFRTLPQRSGWIRVEVGGR